MNEQESKSTELVALHRWYPDQIDSTVAWIRWRFLGDYRFLQPFFTDTLASIPVDVRLSCQTSPQALSQFSQYDCLQPVAFIFHASRCGSTLLTQLLATSAQCMVISEAPVIDVALRLYIQGSKRSICDRNIEILQGIIRALGQCRFPQE